MPATTQLRAGDTRTFVVASPSGVTELRAEVVDVSHRWVCVRTAVMYAELLRTAVLEVRP